MKQFTIWPWHTKREAPPPKDPVFCVNCKHFRVGFYGIECAATIISKEYQTTDYVTGEVATILPTLQFCAKVNTNGQCPKYEEKQVDV